MGSQQVKWNRRDVLLYAVGVGCKATDLNFVYGERTEPLYVT